ncbi:MAG: CDP-glycerol glycerophosphotransferase family protein [Bifidobacteriaceae bacterium]|nr:CDP-glycerol glycerophosphotransferase family protein [Bifidobacteriaceae bacterium]
MLKPLPKRRRVVFLSRESDKPSRDFKDIKKALGQLDPSIEVRCVTKQWVAGGGLLGQIRFFPCMLQQVWAQARARVIVTDTFVPAISCGHRTNEQHVVQIWHALGAFKRFGRSTINLREGTSSAVATAQRMHEGYDTVLISAEPCRTHYAEAFGTDPRKLRVAPLPRVDHLIDTAVRVEKRKEILQSCRESKERDGSRQDADTRDKILKRWCESEGAKEKGTQIALWAPSMRKGAPGRQKQWITSKDVTALREALKRHGWTLLRSDHPVTQAQGAAPASDPLSGFTTAELMSVADAFVTDYSSAVFEAALMGLPCYFLTPKIDEFQKDCGSYLDPYQDLPGPVSKKPEETAKQIADGAATSQAAHDFAQQWVTIPPGTSPTRCADGIAHFLGDLLDQLPH